jgi:hypothetical protein
MPNFILRHRHRNRRKFTIAEFIHQTQHFFLGRVGRIGTPEKAFRPTLRNLDLDSNATEESDLQSAKQPSPKTSIDEGRMILIKPVSLNACPSIVDNLDPDSNVIE